MTFCILAADEFDEGDIALQIHFTLIQAFCCENDINIVRLNDTEKLAEILGNNDESGEPKDLHCILITVSVVFQLFSPDLALCPWLCLNFLLISSLLMFCSFFFFFSQNPSEDAWKDPALEKLGLFCEESRNVNDWVPTITLPE